jgi:lipoprotein NlpD
MFGFSRARLVPLGVALVWGLSACGSKAPNRAPVEDRAGQSGRDGAAVVGVKQPPGFENAGKAGYYVVKPGDTLRHIGLETGQSYKDIARWNNLENLDKIDVGQVVRVVPPTAATEPATGAVAVSRPVTSSTITSSPLAVGPASSGTAPKTVPKGAATSTTASNATTAPAATSATAASATAPTTSTNAANTASSTASTTATTATPAAATAVTPGSEDDLGWIWPGTGAVIASFDEGKNKGLDLGGSAGDPVLAASDGKVIHAGMGEGTMRHYGNLIVIQHNKVFISAYANNQTLLVKEDQIVKKGQKIAEMGSSGTDKVKLHFELRRFGKAMDPAKYLPTK